MAARSAARDALRAVALDLDIAAIAGASNSAHSLAVLRATSPLLPSTAPMICVTNLVTWNGVATLDSHLFRRILAHCCVFVQ